jgi:hypothetical protein
MADSNPALEAALEYARRGLPVFPVWPAIPMLAPHTGFMCGCGSLRCDSPAKHPMGRLVPRGLLDASTEESMVRHWWACRFDANPAINTRGLVVVDVDPNKGGNDTMRDLVSKHGKLPPTWRVITGGGGRHVYFRDSTGNIRSGTEVLGPGVDIRANGGSVIAPPSTHKSGGQYRWEDGRCPEDLPLADAPAWLVYELTKPKASTLSPAAWRELAGKVVGEGGRNMSITRLSGHLLRRYVDPVVVLQLMVGWNAAYCQPPLAGDEVAKIVRSITEREVRREQRRGAT